jgi:transcriptional regulator with XRE-family HTH domain
MQTLPAMETVRVNVIVQRARRRMSQVALAKKAGVGRATVAAIESGSANPTVGVLESIVRVLGCTIRDLFEPLAADTRVDGAELRRRASAPASESIDATDLFRALDEATKRRGRTRRSAAMERKTPSRNR